jgi:hypothetical protein
VNLRSNLFLGVFGKDRFRGLVVADTRRGMFLAVATPQLLERLVE